MASVTFTASVDPDRRRRARVLDQRQLEHEKDLFLLMAPAHLPLPRLLDQATEAMLQEAGRWPWSTAM